MSANAKEFCWACGAPFSGTTELSGACYLACGDCALRTKADPPPEEEVLAALKRPRAPNEPEAENQKRSKESLRRWQMDQVESLSPAGAILDVGAGYGFFVALAGSRGWQARGVEASAAEWRYAAETLKLPVENKTLEEARFPNGTFDVVTLWEVVELLADPQKTLREAFRVLKPGGWLWLRSNNARFHVPATRIFEAPVVRRLGMKPGIIHLHAVTPRSLDAGLRAAGFDFTEIFPSPMTSGDPYKLGGVTGGFGVRAGKFLMSAAAGAVHFISGEVVSSSFAACAQKPDARKLIVHLITRLDPGGSAENTVFTAEKTDPQKFRSLVVSGPSKNAALSASRWITMKSLRRALSPVNDLRAFFDLKKRLRLWRPDIVHTHTSKAGILGRWAARAANVPRIVHTPHGHVFYGYFGPLTSAFYAWLEAMTARITDDLVALTRNERDESLGFGVGERGQWHVVPSGVALDEAALAQKGQVRRHIRASLKISDEDVVVGMVGRLDPIKGADVLARAAGLIAGKPGRRNVYFLFVGEGPLRTRLEALRRAWASPDKMILLGHRPNPLPFMAAMDIYAQPSLNEGMGKTLVMAQAMGLPVAASRVCGIPEVVLEGLSAALVPPGDAEALAGALEFFLERPGARAAFGAAGAAWARSKAGGLPRFSVERMIKLLEEIYGIT